MLTYLKYLNTFIKNIYKYILYIIQYFLMYHFINMIIKIDKILIKKSLENMYKK